MPSSALNLQPASKSGLRLLAFDGGGLRAISQALIIRDMFHRLEEDQQLTRPARVCAYFDMICGSGLGGLLAIMYGILCMTGDQVVEEFVSICKAVFSERLDVEQRTFRLEEEMKRIVAKFSDGREGRMMFGEEDTCKTFVCAAPAFNTSHPRLFRSYRSRANASPDCSLWEAARATTATAGLFLPISIGPQYIGEQFVSGELGWSNPMDQLTEEAALVFHGHSISCIISIGSGHPGHLSLSNGLVNLFSRIATDCERTAERMERRFGKVPDVYKRLSVEQGMQNLDVGLGNLHEVVSHVQSYLQGSRTTHNIDNLLQDLVSRPERIFVDMISGVVPSAPDVLYPKICPQLTPYFTGRKVELQAMKEYFKSPCDSCRVGVLYGIGGGGKTQLGLQFIHSCRSQFSEVFFVDASDKLTLENSLKAIACTSSAQPSIDDALRLLRTQHDNWLLFLDNADDPTLDLWPYVSWAHGNVLITTRNREVRSHAPKCNIWVDRLEKEDAVELLLRGVDVEESFKTQELALKIVQELGYLALAVNQARAFLAKGLCTLDEYFPLYSQNRQKLLEDKSIQSTDNYKYSVYTTWTISFNKLSSDAALLLQLLSYMHHESIPCRIFEKAWKAFEKQEVDAVPPTAVRFLSGFTAVDSTWDVFRFRKLIGEILSLSLLEFDIVNYSISLHPLVQQWSQSYSQHNRDIISVAQTLLCLATPAQESSQDYAMMRSLIPHLRESMKSSSRVHYSFLQPVGRIYRHGGMLQESFQVFQNALFETRQQRGSKHLDTLNCMSNLAISYWSLGQNYDASKIFETVLEMRKEVLGYEHRRTLEATSNLAVVYSDLGRHQEALKLTREVLAMRKKVLGDKHSDTQASTLILAYIYSRMGRYQDALALTELLFSLWKEVLGPEHPDTLRTVNNLICIYLRLGRYQDALKLNEGTLVLMKQVLGDKHPIALACMNNLAHTYSRIGRRSSALRLHESVFEMANRILGPEHPHTIGSSISVERLRRKLHAGDRTKPKRRRTRDLVKRLFKFSMK
ncbi:hypothetical protein DL96DRAFT_1535379 [Flagelloscypha sp. PMI_526]|nr:hypothetical protein DL96DRAFT_1535379 [Flagelloscypha sp. PMI_526]